MRIPALIFSVLLLSPLLACRTENPGAVTPAAYEVRGEILRLPSSARPEILIRHEAIAGFRDEQGKEVGMEGMTMPFTLAPGTPVDGLAVGDAVRFTLETRWELDRDPVRITRIEKSEIIRKLDLEDGKVPDQLEETPR